MLQGRNNRNIDSIGQGSHPPFGVISGRSKSHLRFYKMRVPLKERTFTYTKSSGLISKLSIRYNTTF